MQFRENKYFEVHLICMMYFETMAGLYPPAASC